MPSPLRPRSQVHLWECPGQESARRQVRGVKAWKSLTRTANGLEVSFGVMKAFRNQSAVVAAQPCEYTKNPQTLCL